MNKLTIKDIDLKDKTILMRVDFNVPLDEQLQITDDSRIKAALPTISYALNKGAGRIVLMSHLGRPGGKVVENLRLDPVAKRLQELLGEPVKKVDDCVGEGIKREIENSAQRVIVLENLRFHPEEEKNDQNFAKDLASLADSYVNDAFGTAHRAHASTEAIARYLRACAGFLLEKELEYLEKIMEAPERPLMVILGGAKVSDKIGIIRNLLFKVDGFLIGGGMAYTFLKAKEKDIGTSKLEPERIELAKTILGDAETKGIKMCLPIDNLVAKGMEPSAEKRTVGEDIPEGWMGLDIGPKTTEMFKNSLKESKTILWNGPLGVFEKGPFERGTKEVAEFMANLKGVTTIIGGGDTIAAITKFGLRNRMTHISTGGGAFLEALEGKVLPAVAALSNRYI